MQRCCCVAAVEQSQVQSVIHQLHRLGFLKGNPAHKTYKVEPYLRPHLAALAQQQPSALYSPSLLGWSQACLQTCATATALYSAHAQASWANWFTCMVVIMVCTYARHVSPTCNPVLQKHVLFCCPFARAQVLRKRDCFTCKGKAVPFVSFTLNLFASPDPVKDCNGLLSLMLQ